MGIPLAEGFSTPETASTMVTNVRWEGELDANGCFWQAGTLGKVDQGGGGTVAKFVSQKNIDTVDLGVPVLSMHAPFELVSKIDVYTTYKAFVAFLNR